MEKRSFHELLKEAWATLFSSRTLWLFGAFIAFASLLQNTLIARFFPENDFEAMSAFFRNNPGEAIPLALSIVAGASLIRLFGKANLIVLLAEVSARHSEESKVSNTRLPSLTLSLTRLCHNFFRAFLLQFSLFACLLLLGTIFALPPVIASWYKPAALDPLLIFSAIAYLGTLLLFLVLMEFAFFYLLLAKLSLHSSFEQAYLLFSRYFGRTVAFGVYTLALLVLFTFFLGLLILTIGQVGASPAIQLLASLIFLSGVAILYQALWFFFFRDLASPSEPEQAEKKIVLSEEAPESPAV